MLVSPVTRLAPLAWGAILAAFPSLCLASPQWSEPGGGPLNTYVSDTVEGPREVPQEVWNVEFAEILSEPAVQDGVAYVVAKRKRAAELVMIDLASGSVQDTAKVPVHGFAEVFVDGTWLVVVSGKKATVFDLRGGELKKGRAIAGKWIQASAMIPGAILLHDGELLRAHDLKTGKIIPMVDQQTGFEVEGFAAWLTKPVVRDRDHATGSARVATLRMKHEVKDRADKKGKKRETIYRADCVVLEVSAMGTRKAKLEIRREFFINSLLDGKRDHQHIVGLPSTPDLPMLAAFCNSRYGFDSGKELKYQSIVSEFVLMEVLSVCAPVAVGPRLYARLADRSIVALKSGKADIATVQDSFGDDVEVSKPRMEQILSGEKAPAETRDGPMSGAGSVVFLGNWAVDVATGKVLWIAPDLTYDGRLIPAADGVVLYAQGQRLVCASDAAGRSGEGGTAVIAAASAPVTMPGSCNAVTLMDGTRLVGDGDIDEEGTVWLNTEDEDEPRSFAFEEVSAIESEGSVEVIQSPIGLVRACSRALDRDRREALVPIFEEFTRRRLVPEARAILEEIDSLGCPDEQKRSLESLLATKRNVKGGTRQAQLSAALKSELGVREAAFAARIEAAEWLASETLTDSASALLADWHADWRSHDTKAAAARVDEVAEDWVQEHFPESLILDSQATERLSRTRAWLPWAKELVAAGAEFANHGEAAEALEEGDEWRGECLVLQTSGIELFTTCEDPTVVGPCLRYAESCVGILEKILDSPFDSEQSRMAVRLHRSRSAYLKEKMPDGSHASRWSAGFYLPSKRISRFYVPDGDSHIQVVRELQSTLVHELVHQFQNERWVALDEKSRKLAVKSRGFWVVEGFARFIEDQVMNMGDGALRIDDPTVPSVEAAGGLLEKDVLIEIKKHFDMSQAVFGLLTTDDPVEIYLTSTLGSRSYGEIGTFYEQSGALVFFMMNRRGPEGRALFVEYMTNFWKSKNKKEGWTKLGFEDFDEFEDAFLAFLRDPSQS